MARYTIRPDRGAWAVIDIWTAEVVVLEVGRQTGLTEGEARALAEYLSRAMDGAAILQFGRQA